MADKLKINVKKLSEAIGISFQRIYRLCSKGSLPKPIDGLWDWPDINHAYIDFVRKGISTDKTISDERRRLLTIKADDAALELEKKRGSLIKTDMAQKVWSEVMNNVVNKIDAIPAKLPPLVHGLPIPEIKAIAEKMIHEVKREIANPDLSEIARVAGGKRGSRPGKPKAASRGKRVVRSKPGPKPGSKRGTREMVHVKG